MVLLLPLLLAQAASATPDTTERGVRTVAEALAAVEQQTGGQPRKRGEPVGAIPQGNPGEWVTTDDYPASALRNERTGTTAFRLTISPAGAVADCVVTESSGTPELDETTCAVIRERARFTPARDARGRAVQGVFSSRVRWMIPKDDGPKQPMEFVFSYLLGADGTVSDCRIEKRSGEVPSGVPPIGPAACPPGIAAQPAIGPDGKPVTRRIRETHSVEVTEP